MLIVICVTLLKRNKLGNSLDVLLYLVQCEKIKLFFLYLFSVWKEIIYKEVEFFGISYSLFQEGRVSSKKIIQLMIFPKLISLMGSLAKDKDKTMKNLKRQFYLR